jgi:hypothetical protein
VQTGAFFYWQLLAENKWKINVPNLSRFEAATEIPALA